MKVAIIGSGDAGKTLATSATSAGHDVTGVKDSDLVFLAVPADKVDEVLDELSNDLDGKVIINVTDPHHGHVQFRPHRGR